MRNLKIVVEKHADGYVAYLIGVRGTVVGEGPTYDAALADVRSALAFHVETFGAAELELPPALGPGPTCPRRSPFHRANARQPASPSVAAHVKTLGCLSDVK